MDANELADKLENWRSPDDLKQAAALLRQLKFENDAFRKELFRIGSMRACSRAAELHGFVSPRQAGDQAREFIATILEKARNNDDTLS